MQGDQHTRERLEWSGEGSSPRHFYFLVHYGRIFADFAQVLIRRACELSGNDPLQVEVEQTVYALDSTTFDLCLSLFPWAKYRRRKGAVRAFDVMDRGFVDSKRLRRFTTFSAFFVTQDKRNLDFQRRPYRKVDKTTGLRSDQRLRPRCHSKEGTEVGTNRVRNLANSQLHTFRKKPRLSSTHRRNTRNSPTFFP